MEWATQWHGTEGKVHADKRTVEYFGRGNHAADAVCFIGAMSVGKAHEDRISADLETANMAVPCLTSPFGAVAKTNGDMAAPKSEHKRSDSANGKQANKKKPSSAETPNKKKKKSRRKKRRVGGDSHGAEADRLCGTKMENTMANALPVYYYEVQILATQHFQGSSAFDNDGNTPAGQRWTSSDDDGEMDEEGGDDDDDNSDSDMKDEDDDDGDGVGDFTMEEQGVHDGGGGPWRGRARRLIHDHLRAAAGRFAWTEDTATTGNATSNGHGDRHSQSRNANGAETGVSTTVSSSSSPSLAPPPPPPSSQQQGHSLSFPLSSSTIQQIRLRLERQQQQQQQGQQSPSIRHRMVPAPFSSVFSPSSSSSTTTPSSFVSRSMTGRISSAISVIHARRRQDSVRHKRSNHSISIGFLFTTKDKIDVCHDELGKQPFSLALVGKTGSILSNGHTFQQTTVRFGVGDTIGCGVMLDTRTFFWTWNGQLIATLAATDVHHFDAYDDHDHDHDHDPDDDDHDMASKKWANQVRPSVSLHEHGECLRALFRPTGSEPFVFDLDAFRSQQLLERQHALATLYASPSRSRGQQQEEETTMHQLVQDYFYHYGYGSALAALHDLHHPRRGQGDGQVHEEIEMELKSADTVEARRRIRQLIYNFQTHVALEEVTKQLDQGVVPGAVALDKTLLLQCRILCVMDGLHTSTKKGQPWHLLDGIAIAQKLLKTYVEEPAIAMKTDPAGDLDLDLDQVPGDTNEVKMFMSALLYRSVDEIPASCPGRRFLLWNFREQVADSVNEWLLLHQEAPSQGQQVAVGKVSALETLMDSLAQLQQDCLSCGASVFPTATTSNELDACAFLSGRKRRLFSHKRRHVGTNTTTRRRSHAEEENHDQEEEEEDDEEDNDHHHLYHHAASSPSSSSSSGGSSSPSDDSEEEEGHHGENDDQE